MGEAEVDDRAAPLAERVALGDFTFERSSGALVDQRDGRETRLAPKPAALLALLIERDGALASREQLREQLWPDVSVDFDASLHHCVRQVRSALGDRAASPRYVETIPRRGYRLVCTVEPALREGSGEVVEPEPEPEPAVRPAPRSSRRSALLAGAAGVAALGLGGGSWWWLGRERPAALRVGILDFGRPSMRPAATDDARRTGARVLVGLTDALGAEADVIGPRSTEPLRERGSSLGEVADALALDYLINVRHVGGADSDEVLVELIRASDGRHVWVDVCAHLEPEAAAAIIAATTRELQPR